jgi:Tol biopolymer transport system component
MDADGTYETRITHNQSADFQPSFSPDGKKIVFASNRAGADALHVMNVDGTDQTPLTHGARGATTCPLRAGRHQDRLHARGRPRRRPDLRHGRRWRRRDQADQRRKQQGEPELLSRREDDRLRNLQRPQRADLHDARQRRLRQDQREQGLCAREEPAFSPGGKKIVFRRSAGPAAEIYTMDRDGSDLKQLTQRSGGEADLLPNWGPQRR